MKSIKIKIPLLIVLISFFLFSGCKKPNVTFEWQTLEAIGSYDSTTDTSYLSLGGFLKINQSTVNMNPINPAIDNDFLFVELLTWGYAVFDGEDNILLITNENVHTIFDKIFVNASKKENDFVWVYVITETPVKGDIFNGRNPDSADIALQIVDDNGNLYRIVETINMNFTRK